MVAAHPGSGKFFDAHHVFAGGLGLTLVGSFKLGGFVVYFLAPIPIWEFGELSLVSCSEIVSRVSSISRLDLGWTFHESVQVKSTQGPRVKRRVSSTSDGGAESVGMYE